MSPRRSRRVPAWDSAGMPGSRGERPERFRTCLDCLMNS
jgi:hypothetical protein